MNKSKIASITVSFSWVFMVIVGTFFIVVAYNVISKYQDNQNIMYDFEIKSALRNVFNNFGRTSGIEENSMAPLGNIFRDMSVEIECNDGTSLLVLDGVASENEFLKNYPTFMTYIEQGKIDDTYMIVESFRMPFKTSNLLAIVSRKNLVVLDGSSQIGKTLEKKFKRGSYLDLNYILVDFTNFDFDNFEENNVKKKNLMSVVFVTDLANSFDLSALENLDMDAYLVQIQKDNDRFGSITFTDKEAIETNYNYFDFDESYSLQTMAALSSPSSFGCAYGMMSDSIVSTYDFYILKSKYYSDLISIDDKSVCQDALPLSQQEWTYVEFTGLLEKVRDNFIDEEKRFINVEDLNTYIGELEQWHLNNIEDYNCPYIY